MELELEIKASIFSRVSKVQAFVVCVENSNLEIENKKHGYDFEILNAKQNGNHNFKNEKTNLQNQEKVENLENTNKNQNQKLKAYDREICFASLKDIAYDIAGEYRPSFVTCKYGEEETMFNEIAIKVKKLECDFVVVILSDTPLLQKDDIKQTLTNLSLSRLNFISLNRSFVATKAFFETGSYSQIVKSKSEFAGSEFSIVVNDETSLKLAEDIMQHNIITRLLKNKVYIELPNKVNIGYHVSIEKGAKLYGEIVLYGDSQIGQATIKNVEIENSFIGDNCYIEKMRIKNCLIRNNVKLESTNVSDKNEIKDAIIGKI